MKAKWLIVTAFLLISSAQAQGAYIEESPKVNERIQANLKRASLLRDLRYKGAQAILRHLRNQPILRQQGGSFYTHRATSFSGDVIIDPQAQSVSAHIRIDGKILESRTDSLAFLVFLNVTGVQTPEGEELDFAMSELYGYPILRVTLPQAKNRGDTFSIVVDLSGTPNCSYSGGFQVNLCAFSPILYMDMNIFLPMGLASDFATADLRISIPKGMTLAATGIVQGVAPSNANQDYEEHHVVQDFPTEARSLSAGSYDYSRIPMSPQFVGLYTTKDSFSEDIAPQVLVDIKNIIRFYEGIYGAYLFPKIEASQITDDAGAAFGWPALLWIPDSMFLIGSGHYGGEEDRTALFAHELGHQWFPDMNKSNDPLAAWLSEGFAEFSSIYYMDSAVINGYLQGAVESYSLMYRYFVPVNQDYPLTSWQSQYVSDPMIYMLVTYYKGAVVTNMLRKVIGDHAFFGALKKLHGDIAMKEAYYDTYKLQQYLEQAYGSSLDFIFMPFVYNIGYPIYEVNVRRLEAGEDGKGRVEVKVKRTSSVAGNKFDLPIAFAVVTDVGEEVHTEFVNEDEKTFVWAHEGRFVRLRVDPERVFIKRVVPKLDGDVDISGEIDGIDLIYGAWAYNGQIGGSYNFLSSVDFDANGKIDDKDFKKILDNFGKTSEEVGQ